MTTTRVTNRTRFCVVDKATVNDASLSFRARGVLLWLLDKPDDWRCDATAISHAGREGREAVRAALGELERAGYLRRTRAQDAQGRWTTSVAISEVPGTGAQEPVVGDPGVGDPAVGGPGALEVLGATTETAAAASSSPVLSTAPPLPLSIPEAPPMDPIEQACMTAAVASAQVERDRGKKITALGKYAAPRARDWQAAYGAEMRALVAEGATQDDLVAWLGERTADPLGPGLTVVERSGPVLPDLTGIAVQQEFVEPTAPVLDLDGHRAGAAAARARLKRTDVAETGS